MREGGETSDDREGDRRDRLTDRRVETLHKGMFDVWVSHPSGCVRAFDPNPRGIKQRPGGSRTALLGPPGAFLGHVAASASKPPARLVRIPGTNFDRESVAMRRMLILTAACALL